MVNEKRWKPLVLRWSALTELLTLTLFFLIATAIEYTVVLYAFSMGVADQNIISYTLTVPVTNWMLTITISPLFHLIPIGVVICLISSWTYLTRCIAVAPQMRDSKQKRAKKIKRRKRGWLKPIERFGKKLSRNFSKFWNRIKTKLLKTRGVSYVWQKIFFARAAIRSALTIIFVFIVFVFMASLMASPSLLPKWIKTLYMDYPAFHEFVKTTIDWAGSVATALPPLGWIASGVNSALFAIAPGFRNSLEGIGAITVPLSMLDAAGKYVFYQNFAAWISCIISLMYGQSIAKRYRRRV